MPFGLQPIHLIVIAIVALLIFGPARLPEIGRGIGRALTEFRRGAREMTEGFKEEATKPVDEPENKIFPTPPGTQPAVAISQPVPQPLSPPMSQPVAPVIGETAPQTVPDRVFCNTCGAPNPAGAQFCNKCGSQMSQA